jgi:hypothetical protein
MKRQLRRTLVAAAACAVAIVGGQGGYGQQRGTAAQGAGATQQQGAAGAAARGRGGFANRQPLPPIIQSDDAYLKWPLTAAQQPYARINGAHLKDMLKQIVAISEKSRLDGVQSWGRYAATPYDAMTRTLLVNHFKRIGLEEVRDQPITQPERWWPKSWSGSLVADGKVTPLKTVFALGGPSTPAGGVELDIVWVGLGTAADFAGRDVRGKAVLIHAMPTPSRRENSSLWLGSVARARELGARMVIIDLAIPGSPDVITKPGTGGGEDDAGDDLTVSLSPGESDVVRDLIGQGQTPKIRYQQEIVKMGGPTGVVMGKLSGTTDENIIIEAHADGDFWGAMDNAAGMAQLLGLAEYYAAVPKAQRRRNLIFVVNSDHHSGSAGLAWMRANVNLDKTVLDFNCEHPAQTQTYWISGGLMTSNTSSARRINLGGNNGTETLRGIIKKNFKEFGVATYTRPDGGDGNGGNGYSAAPPRIGVIDHTFYHTTMDTPDFVPAIDMERATQAYASILDEVNKLNINQIRLPKAPLSTQR